ncbi:hypothetical protein P20652_1669 [Pseudoalteromonas sp. BSi20652]|nr:hypothetical protein P20652_1669 [Pseudoalteromonas sp. BSi20652]
MALLGCKGASNWINLSSLFTKCCYQDDIVCLALIISCTNFAPTESIAHH